mmetsp:Transcript_31315/g.57399  ORF Transcript_31315/g.57399 Transcript_31315/m.57399 type:complete len:269 (-) Transcript_31315:63-869(-)
MFTRLLAPLFLLAHDFCAVEVPLIGIFPTLPSHNPQYYQQWLEQAGARTVILPTETPPEKLRELFLSLNAFLMPGGEGDLPDWTRQLVWMAVEANRAGDYFPVWGVCHGFGWVIKIFGGDNAMQCCFDSHDHPLHLTFTSQAPGKMFAKANASLTQWFAEERTVYDNHHHGIEPAHAAHNPNLTAVLDVLATGTDRVGRPLVAAVEGKDLPIYGTQFHSEDVLFLDGAHAPKSAHAMAGARHFADFFVDEAKKNKHVFFPLEPSIVMM